MLSSGQWVNKRLKSRIVLVAIEAYILMHCHSNDSGSRPYVWNMPIKKNTKYGLICKFKSHQTKIVIL
jgi:hypothetical protein